ncbi:hypothetical protein ONZ45_g14592 [Pleurotus djamor]|nr:hypothetical protein ONZ45_g14592 [Pleurotus djamor]
MRLPFDDPKNGIGNAWLPAGCKFIEQDDGIEMFDEEGTYQCFYQSYLPGTNRAELEDVADVVVVAKPDEAYKTAWGGFHLFGRIRPSDGLVVLAGEAVEVIYPSIFRGYASMRARPSLSTIPQEILEHITFVAATQDFLGPPSAIIPLLCINKRFNSCLSIKRNPLLYSRIFSVKFDISPPLRRLRCGTQPTATILAEELRRRFWYLTRMRNRIDSTVDSKAHNSDGTESLRSLLWTAYLMMLENDGKNEKQLREYGRIDDWLREFWFDEHGASFAKSYIQRDRWPPNNDSTSLAMWLFWFLLKPEEYLDNDQSWNVVNTLKIFALGAHQASRPPLH